MRFKSSVKLDTSQVEVRRTPPWYAAMLRQEKADFAEAYAHATYKNRKRGGR